MWHPVPHQKQKHKAWSNLYRSAVVLVAGDHVDKQTSIYYPAWSDGGTTYLLFPASPEIYHPCALQSLSIHLLRNFLMQYTETIIKKIIIKTVAGIEIQIRQEIHFGCRLFIKNRKGEGLCLELKSHYLCCSVKIIIQHFTKTDQLGRDIHTVKSTAQNESLTARFKMISKFLWNSHTSDKGIRECSATQKRNAASTNLVTTLQQILENLNLKFIALNCFKFSWNSNIVWQIDVQNSNSIQNLTKLEPMSNRETGRVEERE